MLNHCYGISFFGPISYIGQHVITYYEVRLAYKPLMTHMGVTWKAKIRPEAS